jgi:uncharacterized repeat protein (TIGR03803 family)
MLYGTTLFGGGANNDGTAFAINRETGAETVVYSFCSQQSCADGASPYAPLIDVKGTLYSTTLEGGSQDYGTAFSLDPDTDTEKVVYSFCSEYNCTDGRNPIASVIDVKGTLYGTSGGGTGVYGVAFALDANKGKERVLYAFCGQQNCADGAAPTGLIDVNGTLYGTTAQGGAYACGVIGCGVAYSLDPKTGEEIVLHSFGSGSDGQTPQTSPLDINGTLYGTTYWGGSTSCDNGQGCGTVFALDQKTGSERVLYYFCTQTNCADGANPSAGLIEVHGTLYGTTTYGGGSGCDGYGCGTVFSLDPNSGAEKVLHTFCSQQNCTDGAEPAIANLICVKGTFYGTTSEGGAYGYGTVFVLKKTN